MVANCAIFAGSSFAPQIHQLTPSCSLPSERGDAGFARALVTLSAKPIGLESGRKEERFLRRRARKGCLKSKINKLVGGGFHPVEKYESNWIISPSRGEN